MPEPLGHTRSWLKRWWSWQGSNLLTTRATPGYSRGRYLHLVSSDARIVGALATLPRQYTSDASAWIGRCTPGHPSPTGSDGCIASAGRSWLLVGVFRCSLQCSPNPNAHIPVAEPSRALDRARIEIHLHAPAALHERRAAGLGVSGWLRRTRQGSLSRNHGSRDCQRPAHRRRAHSARAAG